MGKYLQVLAFNQSFIQISISRVTGRSLPVEMIPVYNYANVFFVALACPFKSFEIERLKDH